MLTHVGVIHFDFHWLILFILSHLTIEHPMKTFSTHHINKQSGVPLEEQDYLLAQEHCGGQARINRRIASGMESSIKKTCLINDTAHNALCRNLNVG